MIDFIKYRVVYLILSSLVIIPGMVSLSRFGLKLSIEFTGGTEAEYRFGDSVTKDQIISSLGNDFKLEGLQLTSANTYLFRLPPLSEDETKKLSARLATVGTNAEQLRLETLGPTLGRELVKKTVAALVLAAVLILAYVAYAFRSLKYGVCATIATLHDSLVILGIFSLLGWKWGVQVDSLFVTAVLTVLSFSVHDTIVVFDRIRESQKVQKNISRREVINKALNETMVRSVNNSLTIIFMLTALLLMGGETIRWFVFALLVGTISGTYSSPFVATPLLTVWDSVFEKRPI